MSKQGFIPSQVGRPEVPESVVQLPTPAELTRTPQPKPPVWVWMVVFIVAVITLMVILYRSGGMMGGGMRMGSMLILPIMLISMLMMYRNRSTGGNDKTKPAVIGQTRADHLRRLDEVRADVHAAARQQAAEIAYHHPNPTSGALLTLVNTGRMWERGPNDRNFGHVRLGKGVSRLKQTIEPPANVPPPEYRETVTSLATRDFLLTQNVVHDVARPLHLFDKKGWAFFAEPEQREQVQAILRALVCQLCVFHSPESVRVAIVTDDLASWEWAKWLPHVADRELVDASGPARSVFSNTEELMERFGPKINTLPAWSPRMEGSGSDTQEWLVVVVDMPGANCAPILGVSGRSGLSVLEATGDEHSVLSTAATAFMLDDDGNLLRAQKELS